MAANDRDALDTFRIKTEVSVNAVRQMIEAWLPADDAAASAAIRSAPAPHTRAPQLYDAFPGERKARKLAATIAAKKAAGAAARAQDAAVRDDAADSKSRVAAESAAKPKKRLGGASALDKYLSKKGGKNKGK